MTTITIEFDIDKLEESKAFSRTVKSMDMVKALLKIQNVKKNIKKHLPKNSDETHQILIDKIFEDINYEISSRDINLKELM